MRNIASYRNVALPGSIWDSLIKVFNNNTKLNDFITKLRVESGIKNNSLLFDDLNRTKTEHRTSIPHKYVAKYEEKYEVGYLKKLAEDLSKKRYSFFECTINGKTHFFKTKEYLYKENDELAIRSSNYFRYIHWVKELYVFHNIPLSSFSLSTKEKNRIMGRGTKIIDLKIKDRSKDAEHFYSDYKSSFDTALEKMEEYILIADYLERYKEKHKYLDSYYYVHSELYSIIEEKLRINKSIQYTRVIALPHGANKPKEAKWPDDPILEFLTHCSIPLFIHICRCLNEKLIRGNKFNDKILPGFFVLNRNMTNYQYALIDNFISSEYYRYSIFGACFPDILMLRETTSKDTQYEVYLKGFYSMFKPEKKLTESDEPIPEIDKIISINDIKLIERILNGINLPDDNFRMKQHILKEILQNRNVDYNQYKASIDF